MGWIKTNEQLPEIGQMVIVRTLARSKYETVEYVGEAMFRSTTDWPFSYSIPAEKIIYWMEIPKLPEEEV